MSPMIRRLIPPVLALVTCSCRGLAPDRLQPIEGGLSIAMREELGPGARTLLLQCRTEKTYGCSNYRLASSLRRLGSTIWIEFRGIETPTICLTALGPAWAHLDLGSLADGDYGLRLGTPRGALEARLTVSGDSYSIVARSSSAFRFTNPVLRRVPAQTIWGTIGYVSPTLVPRVQEYLDALGAIGATVPALPPGDYGYFSVSASGVIKTPEVGNFPYTQPYAFHYAGDIVPLLGVLAGHSDSLWTSLYTDRGERFFSWVLPPVQ